MGEGQDGAKQTDTARVAKLSDDFEDSPFVRGYSAPPCDSFRKSSDGSNSGGFATRNRSRSGDALTSVREALTPKYNESEEVRTSFAQGKGQTARQLSSHSISKSRTLAAVWSMRSKITLRFIVVTNLFTIFCAVFIPTHLGPHPGIVRGIAICLISIITMQLLIGPGGDYGKFGDTAAAKIVDTFGTLPCDIAWATMELPSFIVPLIFLMCRSMNGQALPPGAVFLGLFMFHYFQRSYIYPWLLRGRPYILFNWCCAVFVTTINGTMQALDLLYGNQGDDWSVVSSPRALFGFSLFFFGMATNVHSDYILRNLRAPGDIGYKIPRGGMFEYISGANTWGESVEWTGYAIASGSLSAVTFSVFCWVGIGVRCIATHNWYVEKFKGEYPSQRKRILPFIW